MNLDISTLLLGILLSLLILISIIGNVLVCIAVATEKQLRKLSNLFLVSLAIADLLVAAFVMPFALMNDLSTWRLGVTFCKIWISSDVMCSTASIINLCAISLDRFIHIKDPLQYTELITRRSVPTSIAIIWATSALISFLPISLNLHAASKPESIEKVSKISSNTEELFDSCALDFNPSYSIISSFISFFIPCLIMLLIYFHVYNLAQYHMRCIQEQNKPLIRLRKITVDEKRVEEVGGATNGTQQQNNHSNVHQQQIQQQDLPNQNQGCSTQVKIKKKKKAKVMAGDSPLIQEHKAAITIGIIMGIFLLCWTPFFIVNVVSGFCKECIPPTVFKVLTWLGYSNSVFNPIIYSIFNVEFRQAFQRILTQKLWCGGVHNQTFDL